GGVHAGAGFARIRWIQRGVFVFRTGHRFVGGRTADDRYSSQRRVGGDFDLVREIVSSTSRCRWECLMVYRQCVHHGRPYFVHPRRIRVLILALLALLPCSASFAQYYYPWTPNI